MCREHEYEYRCGAEKKEAELSTVNTLHIKQQLRLKGSGEFVTFHPIQPISNKWGASTTYIFQPFNQLFFFFTRIQ